MFENRSAVFIPARKRQKKRTLEDIIDEGKLLKKKKKKHFCSEGEQSCVL